MKTMKARLTTQASFFLRAQASDYQGSEPPSMATDAHLEQINRMKGVLRPLTADDVYVRGMMAANNLPMRGQYKGLLMPAPELDVLAVLAPAKKVHCVHDTGELDMLGGRSSGFFSLPIGTIFAADRARIEGIEWARFLFVAARTPITREAITRVDSGIVSEVSINTSYSWLECSLCRKNIRGCEHIPGEGDCLGIIHGVKDFVECSLVGEGAMQGTSLFDPSKIAAEGELEGDETGQVLAARGSLADLFGSYEPETLESLFGK